MPMEMLLFGALLAGLVWGAIFYRHAGWWGMLLATLVADLAQRALDPRLRER